MEGLGKDPGPDETDGFDMRKSMPRDTVSACGIYRQAGRSITISSFRQDHKHVRTNGRECHVSPREVWQ